VQRQLAQITALRTIDMTILVSLDVRLTLHVVLDHVVEQLHVDAADVLLYHSHSQTLEYAASRSFRTAVAHGVPPDWAKD
jgi:hypothetical protein